MVDLTAAMIGDPDVIDPVLNGDFGVLGGLDAFEHERQTSHVLDPVHRVPGQPGLPAALRYSAEPPRWRLVTGNHRTFAPTVVRYVDCERERRVARGFDSSDEVLHPFVIAEHVQLEDFRGGAGGHRFFE